MLSNAPCLNLYLIKTAAAAHDVTDGIIMNSTPRVKYSISCEYAPTHTHTSNTNTALNWVKASSHISMRRRDFRVRRVAAAAAAYGSHSDPVTSRA